MLGTRAATLYQRNNVQTVSRERLLLMLFDGAIGFSRASKARFDASDPVGFREYLGKSQAIVAEFLSTLNMEAGGEIAENLRQLYLFLIEHMNRANAMGRGENMEDVARILMTIREGFDGAIRSLAASEHSERSA